MQKFIRQNEKIWDEYEDILSHAHKSISARKKLRDLYPVIAGHYAFILKSKSDMSVKKKIENYLHFSRRILDINRISEKKSLVRNLFRFYFNTIPHILHKNKRITFIGMLFFLITIIFSFIMTIYFPDYSIAFFNPQEYHHYRGQIEAGLKFQNFFVPNSYGPVLFGTIFLNNLKVALMCTASGIFFGIGTVYILVKNAFLVGGLSGLYYSGGHFEDFITQIMQHGFLELMAISLAGVSGFILSSSYYFSGYIKRKDIFRRKMKEAALLFGLVISLLFIAATLEAFITTQNMDIANRKMVIWSTIIFFMLYFIYCMKRSVWKKLNKKLIKKLFQPTKQLCWSLCLNLKTFTFLS